jgi:hypothetical protein
VRRGNLRWVLPTSVISVVVTSVIGLVIDPKGFAINILASVVSIIISFALALQIVERYVHQQRQQQWAKVQDFTLRAIAVHLCEITGSLFLHYPRIDADTALSIFEGHRTSPDAAILTSFDRLLDEIRQLPSAITQDKSTSDIALDYYESVQWDLDQIQNVLTPRVMQSPVEQALIDRLIEFDSARRELHHAIIAHAQAVTHSVFPHVITLIEAARRLYQEICQYLHSPAVDAA